MSEPDGPRVIRAAVSLCIRRERDTLSHRVDARDGPVMEPSMLFRVSELLVNTAHFANNSRIQIEDNLPSKNADGTRRSAASPALARASAHAVALNRSKARMAFRSA